MILSSTNRRVGAVSCVLQTCIGRRIPVGEHSLNKANGLESRKADRGAQQHHSGNSCSCAGTDRIGLPFRRTLLAMPRGGSWYLNRPWSPYHPPRLAPGEVTPDSLHWHRYNTGSQQSPVISPGSAGLELGARGCS